MAVETGHHLLMWTTGASIGLRESEDRFVGLEFADRRRRELEALPQILSRFVDDGFALVTVGELLTPPDTPASDLMKVGG